jgi:hypothetical protein
MNARNKALDMMIAAPKTLPEAVYPQGRETLAPTMNAVKVAGVPVGSMARSLMWDTDAQRNTRAAAQNGTLSPKERQQAFDTTMQGMAGMTSPLNGKIPQSVQMHIQEMGNTWDNMGNVTIPEHGDIINYAEKYLPIPKKYLQRMGSEQILSELRSMVETRPRVSIEQL